MREYILCFQLTLSPIVIVGARSATVPTPPVVSAIIALAIMFTWNSTVFDCLLKFESIRTCVL